MAKIHYEITVDLVNDKYNTKLPYPLIQGTEVQFDITLLNNHTAIELEDEEVSAFIVSYDKLDAGYTIIRDNSNLNVISYDGEYPSTGDLSVIGAGLTANPNNCALILKIDGTYSTPFKYYVQENPAYLIQEEDNNE